MLKTRGIIIGNIKYGETSLIIKVFTEEKGIQSYLVKNVRSKKPTFSPINFSNLNIVEIVAYDKKQNLNYLKEIKQLEVLYNLLSDPRKQIIAIFISELLGRVLLEDDKSITLFEFLITEIKNLNTKEIDLSAYVLDFMLQLSHYLGIGITNEKEITNQLYNSPSKEDKSVLKTISNEEPKENSAINIKLVNYILRFFQLHFPSIEKMTSTTLLESLSL